MSQETSKTHNLKAVPRAAEDQEVVITEACSKCHDTGMEVVEGKGARICDCRKNKSRQPGENYKGLPS
ncbi:MAG: hypothetical protein ACJ73D_12445, partial [Pyrinomonadaceae bacterium]